MNHQTSLPIAITYLLTTVVSGLLTGCTYSENGGASSDRLSTYRVRADISAALNADTAWAAATNESATVVADQPFRIRFEVERPGDSAGQDQYGLQYRRNNEDWSAVIVSEFPYPENATPRVSITSTEAYEHAASTTDLLNGSDLPFVPGAGLNVVARTPVWSGGNAHTEWEWPLVIRRFADGAVRNDAGDTLEFRLVDAGGKPLASDQPVQVTLDVPSGHLGGTFVETPGRIGPWQASNGDLYFIMEPAETDNVLMVVKSSDDGDSWREMDGANRPVADDLEGLGSDLLGDTIHILHQTSDHVWYHAFSISDHPSTPDSWVVRDELVASPPQPPTQVASIAARSDGSLVCVYGGAEKIRFNIRSAAGQWGKETIIDEDIAPNLSGPMVVNGADSTVHLAYTGADGTGYVRSIQPDGSMTPRQLITSDLGTTEYDVGSILPLVFVPETHTVVVIYRIEDGTLWERRKTGDGPLSDPVQITDRLVAQNPVDSDQTAADAIADGATVHVLFVEEDTGNIFHTRSDGSEWSTPEAIAIDVQTQWIRGTLLTNANGARVYGYVFDAGSNGGSGMNLYGEVAL